MVDEVDVEEERQFWNEFAAEYAQIQAESQTTIQEDLAAFFTANGILPAATFLDLAGGNGKYIAAFLPHVAQYTLVDFSSAMLQLIPQQEHLLLIEEDQQSFLARTPDQAFDVVFTAMNPALRSPEALQEVLRIAKQTVCIVRLIDQRDLFSPLEELLGKETEQQMDLYKSWLRVPYQATQFTYHAEEVVTRAFFEEYFAEEVPQATLKQAADDLFKGPTAVNQLTIVFELLTINLN